MSSGKPDCWDTFIYWVQREPVTAEEIAADVEKNGDSYDEMIQLLDDKSLVNYEGCAQRCKKGAEGIERFLCRKWKAPDIQPVHDAYIVTEGER